MNTKELLEACNTIFNKYARVKEPYPERHADYLVASTLKALIEGECVVVPREPTRAMLEAGQPLRNHFGIEYAEAAWRGMLAASEKA